jgi:hypothetical protein
MPDDRGKKARALMDALRDALGGAVGPEGSGQTEGRRAEGEAEEAQAGGRRSAVNEVSPHRVALLRRASALLRAWVKATDEQRRTLLAEILATIPAEVWDDLQRLRVEGSKDG